MLALAAGRTPRRRARPASWPSTSVGSSTGAEVLVGNRIVEVRAQGINKGRVARAGAGGAGVGARNVAAGEDSTDEDLFRGLAAGSIAIRIGAGPTVADCRLPDGAALRALLRRLAAPRRGIGATA